MNPENKQSAELILHYTTLIIIAPSVRIRPIDLERDSGRLTRPTAQLVIHSIDPLRMRGKVEFLHILTKWTLSAAL